MALADDAEGAAFDVSDDPGTTSEEASFEGANVCRVVALGRMLANDRTAIAELTQELAILGFPAGLRDGHWRWNRVDPFDAITGVLRDRRGLGLSREMTWQALSDARRYEDAMMFVVKVLGSRLERESAAAAATLWLLVEPYFAALRIWWSPDVSLGWFGVDEESLESVAWDPDRWLGIYTTALGFGGDVDPPAFLLPSAVRWRLERAVRSPDPVTRSYAAAALQPPDGDSLTSDVAAAAAPTEGSAAFGPDAISTMIHGTRGWKGKWWRPAGDFYEYVHANHRPNLYKPATRFSWSGAWSRADRDQAGIDFTEWVRDAAPGGVQSVFGHSYGGEVAARAVLAGALINEIVLLSTPVTDLVDAAVQTGVRVVDVRLRFDAVLLIARAKQNVRQRLKAGSNATEVILNEWLWDHDASHSPDVWRTENVAARGGL